MKNTGLLSTITKGESYRNDQGDKNSQKGERTDEDKERMWDRIHKEMRPGDVQGWEAGGPPPEPDAWGCKRHPCASYEEVV